jgi:hypothetical protein
MLIYHFGKLHFRLISLQHELIPAQLAHPLSAINIEITGRQLQFPPRNFINVDLPQPFAPIRP